MSCVFSPPCSLILFGVDHGVLDGFVDQSVHVQREGADGFRQTLPTAGQELLSLSVGTKLHLTEQKA